VVNWTIGQAFFLEDGEARVLSFEFRHLSFRAVLALTKAEAGIQFLTFSFVQLCQLGHVAQLCQRFFVFIFSVEFLSVEFNVAKAQATPLAKSSTWLARFCSQVCFFQIL
jgi:hypothetical protein